MSIRKQTTALLFSAAIIMAAFCPAFGQAGIYLDHVDGVGPYGCVPENGMVTFHMRVVGDEYAHLMLNNGYKICMDDRTWSDVTVQWNPAYPINTWFDFVVVANVWDGPYCDTVGTGLLALFGSGLPANFDDILYSITIGPVDGSPQSGQTLTLDSSWYPPSNPWMWDIVGENVDWGGPYVWTCYLGPPPPYTYCLPQPTVLKAIDRVLYIYIENENVYEVILESIRIQGNIPSYEPAYIEGGTIVASVFIMRFLGASGFRPITGDFETTYTVEYDKVDGTHVVLVGDYALKVYPGDVTFDGKATIDDLIFAADYFWRGGDIPTMRDNSGQAWEVTELLDIDGNGEINPLDVRSLMEVVGL